MTDSRPVMKWICRLLLALLFTSLTYVVIQPEYNFAHWVPHSMLRGLGIPYQAILYFETNADVALHLLGSLCLGLLLYGSGLRNKLVLSGTLICMLFLAEIVQWQIGRGFDFSDIAMGIIGLILTNIIINQTVIKT